MASKPWDQLSPDYRRRMKRNGITREIWGTPTAIAKRQSARGHSATPERPERAVRNPGRYTGYLESRSDLVRRVQAKQRRLFDSRHKWRPGNAAHNLRHNPYTGKGVTMQAMRAYLKLSDDQLELTLSRAAVDYAAEDYEYVEWYAFFYH